MFAYNGDVFQLLWLWSLIFNYDDHFSSSRSFRLFLDVAIAVLVVALVAVALFVLIAVVDVDAGMGQ